MKTPQILLLLLLLQTASCKKQDFGIKPDSLPFHELFKGMSPFYDTIPSNAAIDANSAEMVSGLVEEANIGFVVAVKEWSFPIYFADPGTPLQDVRLTANWAPKRKLVDAPIPDWAEPDPEDDGSMIVVDEARGCVWDFWQMRYVSGRWKASWANAIPIQSDGIFPKGLSCRGSGFSYVQGLIWPQELEAGEINHALLFSYDLTKSGGPVAPATESDGTTNQTRAIPEGALVRLDPSLDLSTLGLNSYEMTIAKALQKYGMYCGDDGGGLTLYAVNPICVRNNPYLNIWGDKALVDLSRIPADRFQVMALPPQNGNVDPQIVPNGCAKFE